jgi:GNAT superfamily N-acetyltransferase
LEILIWVRTYTDLHSIVVHPAHRGRGAGRLLIRWGLDKADELGIETVVSSLVSARGAYERCGLGCIEMIPPDRSLNVAYPSEKWKELESDNLSGWLMWRPVGRDFVPGVDRAPWV